MRSPCATALGVAASPSVAFRKFPVVLVRRCNIAGNIRYSGMRLVVDTAVMVSAIRSDTGASRHLLVAGLGRRFTMLVSVPLLIEYQAVMTRPEHLAASGLSVADVEAVLDAVAAVLEPVRLAFLWRPV